MSTQTIETTNWNPDFEMESFSEKEELDLFHITPCKNIQGILDISFEDYRKLDGLNFHTLKDFTWDTKAWKQGYFEKQPRTSSLKLGTQFHELILQGEEVFSENNILFNEPVNPKTGKPYGKETSAYKEARDSFLAMYPNKQEYSEQDYETLKTMQESIMFHPYASKILLEARPKKSELVLQGYLNKTLCKCSIDRYDDMFGLIDLKTCERLTDFSGRDVFRYAIRDYKYIEQLAFYKKCLEEIGCCSSCPATIIAVETKPPFRCGVYAIKNTVLKEAQNVVEEWLENWVISHKTKTFISQFDGIFEISNYYKN